MATPYIGLDTRIAFGEEATWGTEVARTVSQRLISTTLQRRSEYTPLPHLVGSTTSQRVRGESYQVVERVNGTNVAVAGYEGSALGILLKHALGTLVDTGAGPTYTHTYTVGQTQPTGLSAALQRGTSTTAEEFYGLKVASLDLDVEAGGVMRLSYDLVGKNGGTRAAASPAITALATLYPIGHNHAGTLSWNSATYTLRKLKVHIDNKIDRDLHELGSLYVAEPPIADFADIYIECELFNKDDTLYAGHIAKTSSNAVVIFTDTTRTCTFTGHNCIVETYDDGISSAGPIMQKIRFRPYSDATNGGLAVAIVNSQTTGILT